MVTNCRREVRVRRSITTTPPPSTVSTVRANKFGVIASKSYQRQKISRRGNRCRITTHLQHAHSEGLSEDLVGFRVVAVSYLRGSDEEIKRIVLFHVDCSTFQLFLQLLHPLLAMAEVFVCVLFCVCIVYII